MNKLNLSHFDHPIKINQKKYFDKRGFFQEIYLEKKFGLKLKFTAIAKSKKNVIRGLHFQLKNKQTKLIYVVDGTILDVVVNLRKKSKNFGKVYKFILKEGDILFVPNFYGHGYECLSKKCTVLYHLEKYRDKKNELGIRFDDDKIKKNWHTKKPILSKRDKLLMNFKEFKKNIKTL